MVIAGIGALFFGLVIGWISYRILRLAAGTTVLSDIVAIIAAVGGAAVTLFGSPVLFGWYCIGLALGFFAYLGLGVYTYGKQEVEPWRLTNTSFAFTPTPPAPVNPPPVSLTDAGNTSEVESDPSSS